MPDEGKYQPNEGALARGAVSEEAALAGGFFNVDR